MDLHYSQTYPAFLNHTYQFESPMDLHYSQTSGELNSSSAGLNPLWIYTTLKRAFHAHKRKKSLNPLWIYTTLKLSYGIPQRFQV